MSTPNRPLTAAILDFLKAVELSAPGMADKLTLTVPQGLFILMLDEMPSDGDMKVRRHIHYWGGALEVRDGGISPRPRESAEHKDATPAECVLPAGHHGSCLTPAAVAEQVKAQQWANAPTCFFRHGHAGACSWHDSVTIGRLDGDARMPELAAYAKRSVLCGTRKGTA